MWGRRSCAGLCVMVRIGFGFGSRCCGCGPLPSPCFDFMSPFVSNTDDGLRGCGGGGGGPGGWAPAVAATAQPTPAPAKPPTCPPNSHPPTHRWLDGAVRPIRCGRGAVCEGCAPLSYAFVVVVVGWASGAATQSPAVAVWVRGCCAPSCPHSAGLAGMRLESEAWRHLRGSDLWVRAPRPARGGRLADGHPPPSEAFAIELLCFCCSFANGSGVDRSGAA